MNARRLLRALFLAIAAGSWCALAAAEEVDSPTLDAFAAPFQEEEPRWLPHWTLPHHDTWEQLWRPGDLVDDTYWLRRPWHAGFFWGTMDGDQLTDTVSEQSDGYGGVRFGNDFAPHYGWEVRTAFFSPDAHSAPGAVPGDTTRDWFLDANLVYYPWGDTRIRPYASIGAGIAQFQFADPTSSRREYVFDLPLTIGCKYYVREWLALRGELGDNVAFSTGDLHATNHLFMTLGLELHVHSFETRPVRYGY